MSANKNFGPSHLDSTELTKSLHDQNTIGLKIVIPKMDPLVFLQDLDTKR